MNKKFFNILVCLFTYFSFAHAQTNTFPSTGNVGVGTLSPATTLQVVGTSRFGGTSNYAQFNTGGNLIFKGNAGYKVASDKYVFQYIDIPNYGLFFNSTNRRYEFRDSNAASVFYIHADSGHGIFSGGLTVGSSNLPPSKGLYVSGKVGIGTNAPDVKLHVTGGSGVTLSGGGTIVAGLTTSENLAIDNDEIQARTNGEENTLHLNRLGGNVNFGNSGLVYKSSNGYVGIGTSEPTVPLNVLGGFALSLNGGGNIVTGVTNSYNLGISTGAIQARNNGSGSLLSLNADGGDVNISRGALFVESATNNVGIGATPSAKFHVVIGDDATLSGGGYIVAGPTSSNNVVIDNNEIMARNNSNASTLYLNRDGGDLNIGDGNIIASGSFGNVGIKTPPLSYITLQVGKGSTSASLGIGNSVLTDEGSNTLSTTGNFRTEIDDAGALGTSLQRWREVWAIDGTINTSDERDKTNIKDLNYGLKEIMKLRSVRFNWKDKIDKGDKIGLIAQELQKVLPEVVRDYEYRKDSTGKTEKVAATHLGVMYADIIPVIIRGMQQQQDVIEEQNKKIEALTQLVNNFTNNQTKNAQTESNTKSLAILSDASLQQNAPNPFNQTTVIKYYLPSNAGNASINITDMNGKIVKNIPLTTKGNGQLILQAGMLTAGTYNYSLIINGRSVDTKKMQLLK